MHIPNKTAVLTLEWTIDDSSRAIEERAEDAQVGSGLTGHAAHKEGRERVAEPAAVGPATLEGPQDREDVRDVLRDPAQCAYSTQAGSEQEQMQER